jgi:hypothetical protein
MQGRFTPSFGGKAGKRVNYVSPANPKNGVKASVSNESGQFRASEGKEIKGVHRGGGLR